MHAYTHMRVLRAGVAALALATFGCARGDDAALDTTTTVGGAVDPSALRVTEVDVGKRIGADRRVVDNTDDFTARDTVYVSVETSGTASGATLAARWTFEDGQVVEERSETISPTGDAVTEFHIVKASGWPKGKYTVAILLNGNEVEREEYEVK